MGPKKIVVREVWQHNLVYEFHLIHRALSQFPCVSMDTEFPATVFKPFAVPKHWRSSLPPEELYPNMKQNVDATNVIQIGITLSDADGNLPDFGSAFQYVWQFNFRDFDSECDLQNPESIALLKSQRINFLRNKNMGIVSSSFAKMFKASGLGMGHLIRPGTTHALTWVTFHGLYDFGYLIKILTGTLLPDDLGTFMKLVNLYFGPVVYDLKIMAWCFELYGGLDKVANKLNVGRVVGKSHQAGSDSLITMQAFLELRKQCWSCREGLYTLAMKRLNYELYGLTAWTSL